MDATRSLASIVSDNVAVLDPTPRRGEGSASDKELAQDVLKACHVLQEAMDKAVLAGLIVEPQFQQVANRFARLGVSADSHLVKITILRQLS